MKKINFLPFSIVILLMPFASHALAEAKKDVHVETKHVDTKKETNVFNITISPPITVNPVFQPSFEQKNEQNNPQTVNQTVKQTNKQETKQQFSFSFQYAITLSQVIKTHVKETVDKLHGTVSVDSKKGEGTTFKITIPNMKIHQSELHRSVAI